MSIRKIYYQSERTVKTKIKGYVEMEIDFTQIYHTIFKHIRNVNDKWALKYIFWILDKANSDNMIPHGDKTMQDFIDEFPIDKQPSVKTIRDAITELVRNEIFIKYGYGQYQLNPVIIWGKKSTLRQEHIIKLKQCGFEESDFDLLDNGDNGDNGGDNDKKEEEEEEGENIKLLNSINNETPTI